MMKYVILLALFIGLIGCATTHSTITEFGADGKTPVRQCEWSSGTAAKDVSGVQFSNFCGATVTVANSDANAAMAQGMMQMMNLMVPMAIRGMMVP